MTLLLSTTGALYCNVQETSYENSNLLNASLTLLKALKPDSATTVATEFLEFHFPPKQNQCTFKRAALLSPPSKYHFSLKQMSKILQLDTSLSVPVNFLARGHATFQGGGGPTKYSTLI